MHDHNFEKQVHQKMEELHLTPSYAVWERVEEKLHKKKRRRFLFWIFFLLAGLFTGGYYLAQNHAEIKHPHTLSSQPTFSHYTEGSAPIKTTVKASNSEKKVLPASGSLHPTLAISAGTRTQSQALSVKVLQSTAHLPIYHDTNQSTGEENKEKQPATAGIISPDKRKESFSLVEKIVSESDPESLKNPLAAIIPDALYLHESVSTAFSIHPDEKKAEQTIKLKKTKNFHWGVNLEVIRTSVNEGSLSEVFKSTSAADQLAANPNPLNNSGGGIVLVPSTPSAVRAGTGFSTGVFLQKKLGSRWTVSTGISYTLFNTSITTGSSRASSVAQYSSSGVDRYYSLTNANDRHTYTNRYHFAGVPVLFQFRINGEKLPVLWEGGVSLSRLIASNALQYSDSLNGYYQNNRLLNRTQFSVLTGVQVKLFSRSQYPVSIGPQVQVGLSSLSAGRAGNRTHLAQYGFKLSTLIK